MSTLTLLLLIAGIFLFVYLMQKKNKGKTRTQPKFLVRKTKRGRWIQFLIVMPLAMAVSFFVISHLLKDSHTSNTSFFFYAIVIPFVGVLIPGMYQMKEYMNDPEKAQAAERTKKKKSSKVPANSSFFRPKTYLLPIAYTSAFVGYAAYLYSFWFYLQNRSALKAHELPDNIRTIRVVVLYVSMILVIVSILLFARIFKSYAINKPKDLRYNQKVLNAYTLLALICAAASQFWIWINVVSAILGMNALRQAARKENENLPNLMMYKILSVLALIVSVAWVIIVASRPRL